MHRITRRLEFDYGHRVLGHEGKCASLHGHRGVVEITVGAVDLDKLGRVVDFSVVKTLVGGWIDAELDHNMLLHPDDPLLNADDLSGSATSRSAKVEELIGRKPFIMPGKGPAANPTAENIADLICNQALWLLKDTGVIVRRVRVYETPNCWADSRESSL